MLMIVGLLFASDIIARVNDGYGTTIVAYRSLCALRRSFSPRSQTAKVRVPRTARHRSVRREKSQIERTPLKVRRDGLVEPCGEGVPGGRHADRDGQGNGRENQRRCPQGGAVDAADKDEFVDEEQ